MTWRLRKFLGLYLAFNAVVWEVSWYSMVGSNLYHDAMQGSRYYALHPGCDDGAYWYNWPIFINACFWLDVFVFLALVEIDKRNYFRIFH